MSKGETRRFLHPRKNTGLVLGKYRLSAEDSFKNLVLTAPTGSGKTTRFLIPALLNVEGSAIVTDPSGEIFQKTSGHLAEQGFDIRVLQPADLAHSLRFNPLHRCHTQQDLRRVATILAGNASSDHSEPFWRVAATNIIFVVLAALSGLAKKDPGQMHLGNARLILNRLGNTEDQAMKTFMALHLDPITFTEYEAFLSRDKKLIASILATACAALDIFSDPDIVKFTATDTTRLEDLREKPVVFYLVIPEDKIKETRSE